MRAGTLADEYAALKERFRRQVEDDRRIEGLKDHQEIFVPMAFLPSMPSRGTEITTVIIGMYPSQNWLTAKDPAVRLKEAEDKIADGFRISASTIWDFVFHFCIRDFVLQQGETYYVTDVSKGAMRREDEKKCRWARWWRWKDLLLEELKLVLSGGAKRGARVIPVGRDVADFLGDYDFKRDGVTLHGIHLQDFLIEHNLGLLCDRVTHFNAPQYTEPPYAYTNNFRRDFASNVNDAKDHVLAELNAADWWLADVSANTVKHQNPKDEWRCEWLIDRYRTEMGNLRCGGAAGNTGGAGFSGATIWGAGKGQSGRTSAAYAAVNAIVDEYNLEVIDKRASGGCLWVVADAEVGKVLERLGFKFAKNGGGATGGRPAWWLRGEPKSPV